jgi:hypothetical protein
MKSASGKVVGAMFHAPTSVLAISISSICLMSVTILSEYIDADREHLSETVKGQAFARTRASARSRFGLVWTKVSWTVGCSKTVSQTLEV